MHFFVPIGHPDLEFKAMRGRRRLVVKPEGIKSRACDRKQRAAFNADSWAYRSKTAAYIWDQNGRRVYRRPFIMHPGR